MYARSRVGEKVQMRCFRTVKGYTGLDHIKNEDVGKEVKIQQ
jgi:hypothetical protein